MDAGMKELMDQFEARFEMMAAQNQRVMDEALGQYQEAMADAQAKMQAAVNQDIQASTEPAAEESSKAAPAAVWVNASDGEQLMLINQEAVVMFMAIFDRMAEVAEAIQKLSKK